MEAKNTFPHSFNPRIRANWQGILSCWWQDKWPLKRGDLRSQAEKWKRPSEFREFSQHQHILTANACLFHVLPTQRATPVLPAQIEVSLCNVPSQPTAFQASSHSTEVEGQTQTRKTHSNDGRVLGELPQLLCRTSVCGTVFKYWQKLEKGEKKNRLTNLLFHFALKIIIYWTDRSSIFFSPWVPSCFFPEPDESEGCILCSDGSSQQRKFPLDQTLCCVQPQAYSQEIWVCVCLRECVCVPLRTRDPYMHCWFCRTELFLKR